MPLYIDMANFSYRTPSKGLKIVWICHFMNTNVKEWLGIREDVKELAPWVTLGIKEFHKRRDSELHVIAPMYSILKHTNIDQDNIHYHFIKLGIPFSRRRWPRWLDMDYLTRFLPFNRQVIKLVNEIKPDLVNLIGAENAYYSSSVLKIKNYPVLVTIQGFISLNNEVRTGDPKMVMRRIAVEKEICQKIKHYAIEDTSTEKQIKSLNHSAVVHWFHLPFAKTVIDEIPIKKYDLAFFARITRMKGIEDLITAVSKLSMTKPDISLIIIGHGDADYIRSLQEKIINLGLVKNIEFKGFIPSQRDMHLEVMKARIVVLPTYNDTIPGTIVESMLLGLPVISYRTGGIPDLNKENRNIILVEQGNIDGLVQELIILLNNPEMQIKMGETAKAFASEEFDNARSAEILKEIYKDVIRAFKEDKISNNTLLS